MQISDEVLWKDLVSELKSAPDGQGEAFLNFIVAWCEQAEQIMGQEPESSPLECLRMTLASTEAQLDVRNSVWVVGQALAVVSMYWSFGGENLIESLTEIESRLLQDITEAKIAQLQDLAASRG